MSACYHLWHWSLPLHQTPLMPCWSQSLEMHCQNQVPLLTVYFVAVPLQRSSPQSLFLLSTRDCERCPKGFLEATACLVSAVEISYTEASAFRTDGAGSCKADSIRNELEPSVSFLLCPWLETLANVATVCTMTLTQTLWVQVM